MKYRPLELRMKLYDEVYRLRNLGLSYNQIIKIIQEKYNEKLSRSHISWWLRGIHSPCGNVLIMFDDIKPSKELSFIIGDMAGDRYTTIRKKIYSYIIGLKCKDVEHAIELLDDSKSLQDLNHILEYGRMDSILLRVLENVM